VKLLRTLPTRRLIVLLAALVALAVGGAAIAVAATRSTGPTPPPEPLDQAIQDALSAPTPDGVTARVSFTNRLFPSGALLGNVGSALMSGASGRLWMTNDGRGRIELQSNAGDVQIVWNGSAVTVYDASSNTVYRLTLPAASTSSSSPGDQGTPPALSEIDSFLTSVGDYATVSDAQPTDVAGRPAYGVSLAPKHDGGLLGSAELSWDAEQGIPLHAAIYAQGSSDPVLDLTVTDISWGAVSAGDVEVQPPSDAKVVDLGSLDTSSQSGESGAVTGLAQVQAAADFPVVAPDTLVGLPRQDVRLVGGSDSKSALAVYGQGLGAVVVVERKPDSSSDSGGVLSSLPTVSLDGVSSHELATQLGTALEWQSGGTAFVLAGSLPPAAAETAARQLK